MKIELCSGSKCVFYGVTHLYESLLDLKEDLKEMDHVDPKFTLDIEFIPCVGICKIDSEASPVAYVDGELIEAATGPILMNRVLEAALLKE